jgi:hypothetical protein
MLQLSSSRLPSNYVKSVTCIFARELRNMPIVDLLLRKCRLVPRVVGMLSWADLLVCCHGQIC